MGIMDDLKKVSDSGKDAQARYEELKSKEQSGKLDDQARQELEVLRNRFEK